ncbi:hypothetical protein QFZ79_000896 [Arthrobacter sp. V4I6]|uniref:hypothetical protein n=1 Tax=Arthrobacter sp. V1I7 TaxID=3042274 RepID=UPI00277D3FEA|nr:hypothetical protein [Arthrobacter sp. V1I7]MDQ0823154.1 hypothetical protein [Arthrobacter sp. V1I7]MDQ0852785.1 hypothetical protein [Arthrobacter sp. V4I6]
MTAVWSPAKEPVEAQASSGALGPATGRTVVTKRWAGVTRVSSQPGPSLEVDTAMTGRFAALRVRPANRKLPRDDTGAVPLKWLL